MNDKPNKLQAAVIDRLQAYGRLIRLDRPVGTFLLLWPTLFAMWLASDGIPPGNLLLVFVAGTFLMRSAGCALNDFADRRVDRLVKRTRSRPLAAGEIKPVEALLVAAALTMGAALLACTLPPLVIGLAVLGALAAGFYPFAKAPDLGASTGAGRCLFLGRTHGLRRLVGLGAGHTLDPVASHLPVGL